MRSLLPSVASAAPPVLSGARLVNGASERPSPPGAAAALTYHVTGPLTSTLIVPLAVFGSLASLSWTVYWKLSLPMKPCGGTYVNVPSVFIVPRAPLTVGETAVAVSPECALWGSLSLVRTLPVTVVCGPLGDVLTESMVLPYAPPKRSGFAVGAWLTWVTSIVRKAWPLVSVP